MLQYQYSEPGLTGRSKLRCPLKLPSQSCDECPARQWRKVLQERGMHTHFLIEQIPALEEDADAVGARLFDAVTYLHVHHRIAGRACLQFRQIILAHNAGCTYIRCPRAGSVIEFQAKA